MGRVYPTKNLKSAAIGLLVSFLVPVKIFAQDQVTVLSWWDYIRKDSPVVRNLEKSCNARISLDEFYSNAEFLQRMESKDRRGRSAYDVLVYSDTVFDAVSAIIAASGGPSIQRVASGYEPQVERDYMSRGFPKNTTIFQLSFSGFLWNNQVLSLTPSDSLRDIFRKADGKVIVLVDDHVEIATLLRKLDCEKSLPKCAERMPDFFPSKKDLTELVGNARLVISSDLAQLTKHKDFAFGYLWSGEALAKLKDSDQLKFLLHPKLSHISMDLISVTGASAAAKCVGKGLSGRTMLDHVAKRTNYFSPFGKIKSTDAGYVRLQDEIFSNLSTLSWVHRVTPAESKQIEEKWQVLKITLGKPL